MSEGATTLSGSKSNNTLAVRCGEACRTLLPNNEKPAIMNLKEVAVCTSCSKACRTEQISRTIVSETRILKRLSRVSDCCMRPIEWMSPQVYNHFLATNKTRVNL
jgi:hypothetical protein